MAATSLARAGRRGAGVPGVGPRPEPPSTVAKGPLPGLGSPARRPPGRWIAPSASASWTCLASPRFLDRSPGEVVATLLDEGRYLCSERTMYRFLGAEQPVRERRNQLSHPHYAKPELLATAPNQVRSWDITRLLGPKALDVLLTSTYLLDIFSRYVVGWMVAERENAALAARLIEQSCLKQAHPAPSADPAFGPRRAYDRQMHRATARRPRRHPLTRPAPSQRQQPVLRSPIQNPEIPPRLPGSLRRHPRRGRVLPDLLPVVQPRASTCRDRHAHPKRRPSRPRPACPRTNANAPYKTPGHTTRNASFMALRNPRLFRKPSGSIRRPRQKTSPDAH